MIGAEPFEQFVGKFGAEFFTLVCDNVQGCSKMAVPFVKNGVSDSVSLFVWQGHQFDVFGECICHAENEFLATVRCFEGAKKISVYAMIRLSGLRKAR